MDKMGVGHAGAMWRQGLNELRNSLYSDSNVARQVEQGIYGTLTQGEIAEARRDARGQEADVEPSLMDEWVREAKARSERDEPPHEPEPER